MVTQSMCAAAATAQQSQPYDTTYKSLSHPSPLPQLPLTQPPQPLLPLVLYSIDDHAPRVYCSLKYRTACCDSVHETLTCKWNQGGVTWEGGCAVVGAMIGV